MAVVLCLTTGGALATGGYIAGGASRAGASGAGPAARAASQGVQIRSLRQISPKVLRKLANRIGPGGATGPTGPTGAEGAASAAGPRGPSGSRGFAGEPGPTGGEGVGGGPGPKGANAFAFERRLTGPPTLLGGPRATLFKLAGGLSMELVCFWISDPIASLYAFGPSGSRAQTRTLVMRSDGGLAQNARFWSFNTTLEPEEKETVALMSSNESAPQTNVAHVDGTLTTAGGENVLFDINMEVTGDTLSGGDYNCSATGTVFITDNS